MAEFIKDLQDNFKDLYKEFKEIFNKIAKRRGLLESEIEDCFHDWLIEKFEKITENIKIEALNFSSKKNFLSYIKKSMDWWIIDYLRIKQRRPVNNIQEGVIATDIEGKEIEKIKEKEKKSKEKLTTPPLSVDEDKFQAIANEIFNCLDLEKKLLFSLYIMSAITLEDISNLLKIPRSTVHYRLKSMVKEIKEILNGKFEFYEEKEAIIGFLIILVEDWWEENKEKWVEL